MTAEDDALDPEIFSRTAPLKLFRITRDKYSDLSGVGAAREPGRWNLPGQEAIYTSLSSSTVQLEKLAHSRKDQIPSNLVMMHIELRGDWSLMRDLDTLIIFRERQTSATLFEYQSLRLANDPEAGVLRIIGDGDLTDKLVGVAVPSVLDPQWNLVLFPQAADFSNLVTRKAVGPFQFDRRLFQYGRWGIISFVPDGFCDHLQ